MLLLPEFDFDLPPERIAQHPARPRDTARLLRVSHEALADCVVRDLPTLLRPGDVLVVNDTRVIPAQLSARRGSARIGITLDQPRPDGTWHALARNARRIRVGDELTFEGADELRATVSARDADGGIGLAFNCRDAAFADALQRAGALALPPYIARPDGPQPRDRDDYQTIFATHQGAVAAPTAGLHFTPALLAELDARGIVRVMVTLHVGAGTFLPVRTDDVASHHMHSERGELRAEAAATINATRRAGGRVVAVGTTSLRLLESAASADGTIQQFAGDTSLFILPGYKFRAVDILLTNFHLPRSTLFMLVCAFAGTLRMRAAYSHAIEAGYRFYSYGDACLLDRIDDDAAPLASHDEREPGMAMKFDTATLDGLRTVQEVSIRASNKPELAVIIWIVTVGDAAFVRSVRGAKGRWYEAASADGRAVLEFDGRQVPVSVTPVADPATIEAVSAAYLVKYSASPYAQPMVRAETLSTTLLLEPR